MLAPEGQYYNYSGCGNTMNCNHPTVRQFITACLRYWVLEMHVDGFRFDLGSIMTRAHSAWNGGEQGPDGERSAVLSAGALIDDQGARLQTRSYNGQFCSSVFLVPSVSLSRRGTHCTESSFTNQRSKKGSVVDLAECHCQC